MPKITPTQHESLKRAAETSDGEIGPSQTPKAATTALLKSKHLGEVEPRRGTRRLRITDADLALVPAPSTTPKAPSGVIAESKIELLRRLISRPGGATIQALQTATGWQAHSVRGAIAGSLKKKLKLPVSSEKTPDGRRYLIKPEATA